MKRTQILISEEQHKLLKDISSKKNISMAEAVRECITYYEKNNPVFVMYLFLCKKGLGCNFFKGT